MTLVQHKTTGKPQYNGPWYLGIDLGTGSCKSLIIDESANVLGLGQCSYPATSSHSSWQEQDPDWLIDGMARSVYSAIDQAGVIPVSCAGISLGGALHSILAIDKSGSPICGLMTWADNRAFNEAQSIQGTPIGNFLYQQTGCPPHGMYPLYKIIWLRKHQPEVFSNSFRFLSGKEYVLHTLIEEYIIDYSLANGSGLLNTLKLEWDEFALEMAEISQSQLSNLSPPNTIAGSLSQQGANLLKLPAKTPVILGSSDAVNSSIGAGAVGRTQATLMVGTSGALRVISQNPVLDNDQRTWCYAIDRKHWLVGGAINNGGLALSWMREMLNSIPLRKTESAQLSYEDILELASQSDCGAKGIICLPFFAGERSPNWNLDARAVFFGMEVGHTASDLARSLLEGIAFRFRSLNDALIDQGIDVTRIHASGGFTQSPLWLQITASVINRELLIPSIGETSALGAALWAVLRESDIKTAGEMAHINSKVNPIPLESEIYERLYAIYTNLYSSIKDSFSPIADIQRDLQKQQ